MKKVILSLCLLFSVLVAGAQVKPSTSDTTVTDSTALLTIADYKEFYQVIQELPMKYASPLLEWLGKRYNERIQQWIINRKLAAKQK